MVEVEYLCSENFKNKAKQRQETNLDISFSVMWHAQNDGSYFVFLKSFSKTI